MQQQRQSQYQQGLSHVTGSHKLAAVKHPIKSKSKKTGTNKFTTQACHCLGINADETPTYMQPDASRL
jgi:hypothetical protein